jgi:hypothetical protein
VLSKIGQRKSLKGTAQLYVVTPDVIDTALPVLSIRHIQYETDGLNCFGRKVSAVISSNIIKCYILLTILLALVIKL